MQAIDRPYVILNAAETVNGKIATKTGKAKISSTEDLIRVHKLRSQVDAIMVGVETVLKDDPKLTVRYIKGKNPIRVIVDSKARIPLNAKALKQNGQTIIATTELAKKRKIEVLKKKGAYVLICGKGPKVNLKFLLKMLYKKGISKLLLEGGGTLNWSMMKGGLVDEIKVFVANLIFGGEGSKTLVEGEGIKNISEAFHLKLRKYYKLGNGLVLEYTMK